MSSPGSCVLEQWQLFTVQVLPLNSGMGSVIDGMEALLSPIGGFKKGLESSAKSIGVKNKGK